MEPENRPSSVSTATALMWTAMLVTLAISLVELTQSNKLDALAAAIYIAVFALGGLLVFAIWARRGRARHVYLALTLLGLPTTISAIANQGSTPPLISALDALLVSVQIYALYLVYAEPARGWFSRRYVDN